jgi:hypothetical protein
MEPIEFTLCPRRRFTPKSRSSQLARMLGLVAGYDGLGLLLAPANARRYYS